MCWASRRRDGRFVASWVVREDGGWVESKYMGILIFKRLPF